jgi:hypothetical protein
VIDTVLSKDKESAKWRADHAHSHVPTAANRPRRNRAVIGRHSVPAMVPPPDTPASMSVR